MTRNTLRNATLILLVLVCAGAYASNGLQIGTVGARSTAMGSNFIGLADDWSASFFNPAGLTQFESKWTIGFSAGVIMPRGSYQATAYPMDLANGIIPFAGMKTQKVDATDRNFLVPALGIFYKASEKMTLGLAVNAPFGLGTEWDLLDLPNGYSTDPNQEFEYKNEHYSDLQVVNIQPTVAFKLSDKISLGLGFSYLMGKMDLRMAKLAPNFFASNWTMIQGMFQQQGLTLPDMQPTWTHIGIENDLSGDGTAMGLNFGLLFEASEKLSIGVSGKYFTDLKLEGTNTMYTHGYWDIDQIAAVIGALPTSTFANFGDAEMIHSYLTKLFQGSSSKESDVTADVPLPMSIGAGLAYKASDNLTLTADVSYTGWSSWDVIEIEVDGGQNLELVQDWSSTVQIGAGMEYKVGDNFFIRAGYYTVDTPAPDETMSPTLLDPNRRHTFTGGLGMTFGKVALNLCGEYVYFAEKTIDDYVFVNGMADNYAGVYNFNAMVFTLGASIALD